MNGRLARHAARRAWRARRPRGGDAAADAAAAAAAGGAPRAAAAAAGLSYYACDSFCNRIGNMTVIYRAPL